MIWWDLALLIVALWAIAGNEKVACVLFLNVLAAFLIVCLWKTIFDLGAML